MAGRPKVPGARKSRMICRCCKGSDIERTGNVIDRLGMPQLPVRCRSCGFTWCSSAAAIIAALAPEARVQA